MLIAVDIDGILTNEIVGWDYTKRTPRKGNIGIVNGLLKQGHVVVLYTARYEIDRAVTIDWLNKYGVQYSDLVMGKLQYDILVDDKAASDFNDTFNEILNLRGE